MDPDRQNEFNVLCPDRLRIARLQLRDAGAALDSGHETLRVALKSSRRFGCGSNP